MALYSGQSNSRLEMRSMVLSVSTSTWEPLTLRELPRRERWILIQTVFLARSWPGSPTTNSGEFADAADILLSPFEKVNELSWLRNAEWRKPGNGGIPRESLRGHRHRGRRIDRSAS